MGDRVVLRPLPSEPIADLVGKYRGRGPSSERARRQARIEDGVARETAVLKSDPHAVIALLGGEPAARQVSGLLGDEDESGLTSLGVKFWTTSFA